MHLGEFSPFIGEILHYNVWTRGFFPCEALNASILMDAETYGTKVKYSAFHNAEKLCVMFGLQSQEAIPKGSRSH